MSRLLQNRSFSPADSRRFDLKTPGASGRIPGMKCDASKVTALNVEFVAKPSEAHKVHAALPPAINGALGAVAGFAGSLVMISNYEARLVAVVTLWSGEDQMRHCNENVRWVRALVAPYLDRCLRIQTLAAYLPEQTQFSQTSEHADEADSEDAAPIPQNEEASAAFVV